MRAPQPEESNVHPPDIPVQGWWAIAVFAAAAFLLFFVPVMPTRGYRIQVLLGPVLVAVFAWIAAVAKGYDARHILAVYAIVMVALPLALVGRRRELVRKIEDRREHGERPENQPSTAMMVQFFVTVTIAACAGAWLIA